MRVPGLPFNTNDTANATFTAKAGVTGKYLNFTHLVISTATADSISVLNGNTLVFGPLYLGQNGGLDLVVTPNELKLGQGEDLKITKGNSATPVTVCGFYTEE